MLTNASEILMDLIVGNAKYRKSQAFQISISFLVSNLIFSLIMLGAVQFDDKVGFVAIGINNVVSDHILPMKPGLTFS